MIDSPASDAAYCFPLEHRILTIGRDGACDIRLKGVGVSKMHARVHLSSFEAYIEDNGETSGVFVDEKLVRRAALVSGAVITIGVNRLAVTLTNTSVSFSEIHEPLSPTEQRLPAAEGIITIGRDPSNQLSLQHPLVSRFHATVRKTGQSAYVIDDHRSTNGTFVNGKSVHHAVLKDGDIVHIGPYRFYCEKGAFHQARDFNRITVEAKNVTVVKSGRTLINNVSIAIEPGEFVAILGPSGAGKTSLARALMGLLPLREGSILFNGLPLKTFFAAFNAAIGFVTQGNILRAELTVRETFFEQCRLRLAKDSIEAEIRERMREVMEMLDCAHIADCRVGTLSGGEAKRVHFGVEMLSSPTIIFFDEPFAGLDPGLVHKFMTLFRGICDKGHTLLLTTHTLEQIDSCDRILFINKGKIGFNGTPKEIMGEFGIDSLSQLYEKQRLAQQEFNGGKPIPPVTENTEKPVYSLPRRLYKPKGISLAIQLRIFIVRYWKISLRDPKNVLLVLLQAPLIALVLRCTFSGHTDYFPVSFYFCLSISAVWMGGMNSIREIAREWKPIERELRIGVSHLAYVASKIVVFGFIAVIQAFIFEACIVMLFGEFRPSWVAALLLSSASVSGTILGLCISVFSKNVNMAISWLPIIFIPQIFFSGILMPFDEMPAIGQVLSRLTIARPVFSMFKKTCVLNQSALQCTEWNALISLCLGLIIFMVLRMKFRRLSTE